MQKWLEVACTHNLAEIQSETLKYVFLDPRRMVPPMWVFEPCKIQQMKWRKQSKVIALEQALPIQSPYLWHENNTGICGDRVKFCTVCIMQTKNRPWKFNHSNLHPETNTQKRDFVFTSIFCGKYFAFYSPITKPSRNQNAIRTLQISKTSEKKLPKKRTSTKQHAGWIATIKRNKGTRYL